MALTVAAVTALAPGLAWACPTDREGQAIRTRVAQSHMMVGALLCDARTPYNAVLARHDDVFTTDGQVLRQYFQRVHGADARRALNAFVTRLANEASFEGTANRREFCRHTVSAMRNLQVVDGSTARLVLSNLPAAQRHPAAVCQTLSAVEEAAKTDVQ